jgi:hypothetical protein
MKTRKYKGGNVLGELHPLVKSFESNYPEQSPLNVITELPDMGNGIETRTIFTKQSIADDFDTQSPNHYWTNDDNLNNVAHDTKTACNIYGIPYSAPPHKHNCIGIKLCYYIPESVDINTVINVDIHTPDYVANEPYRFIHQGTFFGRPMNLFNMLYSPSILRLIEFKNIEWTRRHPLRVSPKFRQPGPMKKNVNGQLITPMLASMDPYNTIKRSNDVKFQMCVKPEYLYWAVETILINYQLLVDAGLRSFKYTFSVGERIMYSGVEIFPAVNWQQPINEYTHKGIQFKTELLNSPNIVFYTMPMPKYTELAFILCRLFPNDLSERIGETVTPIDISTGMSRFNMRLNNNVAFSVDGNNEAKFATPIDIIPDEYNIIIDEVNAHPERCSLLENYSKLITGNTLLTACKVNNILSYNAICYPYPSFKYIYDKYGFMEYYIKLPPDLDAKIIMGELPKKASNIDKYAHPDASLKPEDASLKPEDASLNPEDASLKSEDASLKPKDLPSPAEIPVSELLPATSELPQPIPQQASVPIRKLQVPQLSYYGKGTKKHRKSRRRFNRKTKRKY